MRITNKMLSNNFLRDMKSNLNNLSTLQTQMATGKQIRKASDDPTKASKIMQINSDIASNIQYNKNIKDTSTWLDMTDTALGQIGNVATRIQELLVSAGDAGHGVDERGAIKDEINEKVGELSQILNTTFDGKYIFGGTRGTDKPTDSTKDAANNTQLNLPTDPVKLSQIGSKLSVEVSQGVTMDYNITATDVINNGGATNLSDLLNNITSHLGSTVDTEIAKLNGEDLTGIQAVMTNVLKLRSQVGAKQNGMESALARNEDQSANMTEVLTSTEDIDITEKTMEYATMQTVYTASLQTSAKVLQPSLLDYLR
ncbi:flagellar hook-associated protein FlgL [Clostridium estertheticum]|uniref:flagellar hook-associated protein FlgL n=1 Tax=Clostridium estertheticum TaxID=238834 RepID=UPI001CF2449F|nr:flagellar hook-associated protein FlgL [Clostridium estertheticum]MCB2356284.1 flagellar hook-associated protein FlgL [Clostridium estertheticum]WAG42757.1 flagellar hook-associated protein FlgL [Clostridium estertheticum]